MGPFGEAALKLNVCMTSGCFASSGTATNGKFNLFDWTPSNTLSTTYQDRSILAVPCSFFPSNLRIHEVIPF